MSAETISNERTPIIDSRLLKDLATAAEYEDPERIVDIAWTILRSPSLHRGNYRSVRTWTRRHAEQGFTLAEAYRAHHIVKAVTSASTVLEVIEEDPLVPDKPAIHPAAVAAVAEIIELPNARTAQPPNQSPVSPKEQLTNVLDHLEKVFGDDTIRGLLSRDNEPLSPVHQDTVELLREHIRPETGSFQATFGLSSEESWRLKQFLGFRVTTNARRTVMVELVEPKTVAEIRTAAARGKKATADEAEAALLSALMKLFPKASQLYIAAQELAV